METRPDLLREVAMRFFTLLKYDGPLNELRFFEAGFRRALRREAQRYNESDASPDKFMDEARDRVAMTLATPETVNAFIDKLHGFITDRNTPLEDRGVAIVCLELLQQGDHARQIAEGYSPLPYIYDVQFIELNYAIRIAHLEDIKHRVQSKSLSPTDIMNEMSNVLGRTDKEIERLMPWVQDFEDQYASRSAQATNTDAEGPIELDRAHLQRASEG